ncbi:MAG: hypothetical protein PHD02_04540 [Bacilli bacterium]|nr:hypothetical protein [Bacilli bacterium]
MEEFNANAMVNDLNKKNVSFDKIVKSIKNIDPFNRTQLMYVLNFSPYKDLSSKVLTAVDLVQKKEIEEFIDYVKKDRGKSFLEELSFDRLNDLESNMFEMLSSNPDTEECIKAYKLLEQAIERMEKNECN